MSTHTCLFTRFPWHRAVHCLLPAPQRALGHSGLQERKCWSHWQVGWKGEASSRDHRGHPGAGGD